MLTVKQKKVAQLGPQLTLGMPFDNVTGFSSPAYETIRFYLILYYLPLLTLLVYLTLLVSWLLTNDVNFVGILARAQPKAFYRPVKWLGPAHRLLTTLCQVKIY